MLGLVIYKVGAFGKFVFHYCSPSFGNDTPSEAVGCWPTPNCCAPHPPPPCRVLCPGESTAGLVAGDSACSIPPQTIPAECLEVIRDWTVKLAKELKVVGLINIQYCIQDNQV